MAGADGSAILSKCFAGGTGCGVAGLLTNPMDVVKIRNQQYGSSLSKYSTFSGAARSILAEEGPRGFFKGAGASVLREATYSSLRMGLYEPIKLRYAVIAGDENSPSVKWLSAFTSGAIGAALFNPVDLVKVRLQTSTGPEPPYSSIANAFATIYREKGVAGLYVGTSATVTRAAFLTSAQLGSYDVIKNNLLVQTAGLDKEANSTHLLASLVASVVTTTAANPADVVKTKVMNCNGEVGGPAGHLLQILRTDGAAGLLRGWTASYFRIGPHTVISLVLIEKVRQLIGMSSY